MRRTGVNPWKRGPKRQFNRAKIEGTAPDAGLNAKQARARSIRNALAELDKHVHETSEGNRKAISDDAKKTIKTLDLDKHYYYVIRIRGGISRDAGDDSFDEERTITHHGPGRRFLERILFWAQYSIIESIDVRELAQPGPDKFIPLYSGEFVDMKDFGQEEGAGVRPPRKKKNGRPKKYRRRMTEAEHKRKKDRERKKNWRADKMALRIAALAQLDPMAAKRLKNKSKKARTKARNRKPKK
jgi:hypothetical protein